MSPKFTRPALLVAMSASTRLAITTRDVAGPHESPDGQSVSLVHFVRAMRHMPVVPAAAVILQMSPAVPATQLLVGPGVQVLAGPTQALVSTHGLLACTTVQERRGKLHWLFELAHAPTVMLHVALAFL